MKGARGVLINITGGPDMMLFEVDQAANRIRAEVDPDANIIFGGTILENMEGRLRVSVVATGIEAEAMTQMPQNVEPLRPRMKAGPLPSRPDQRQANSPVHHQMETLAQELNAAMPAREPISAVEPLILGQADTPEIEDDVQPISVTARQAPLRPAVQARPELEEEPKRRFGFLGRKKPEPRVEPQTMPRQAVAPRATAQVMTRPAAAEPQRTTSAQGNAEDLFPDHKKDDQFEIPAFLRRQTN
jgi:cell division protein FtsZ